MPDDLWLLLHVIKTTYHCFCDWLLVTKILYPRLSKQVSLELITIMPRLQIKLLNKKKAISNYNKCERLSHLIFRVLQSWTLLRHCIVLLFQTKEPQLFNNRGNTVTSWNPRWRQAGNLKAEVSSFYFYYYY